MMKTVELVEMLKQNGLTLSSVESFTGGLFAKTITDIPGVSKVFRGGLVTYKDDLKHLLADVPLSTLGRFGAISKETALAMARGGREKLGSDLCVSFTGNAGPDTMENAPIGKTYIAVVYKDVKKVYAVYLFGNREEIRQQAVEIAIDKIIEIL